MIVWKHALRNAAIAPLTYFGLLAGSLLTGSVVIETVFSWPGTGLLAIEGDSRPRLPGGTSGCIPVCRGFSSDQLRR